MTQQDDITQRLRDNADLDEAEHGNARVVQLEREAADEIERLRAELSQVRAPVADERAATPGPWQAKYPRNRSTLIVWRWCQGDSASMGREYLHADGKIASTPGRFRSWNEAHAAIDRAALASAPSAGQQPIVHQHGFAADNQRLRAINESLDKQLEEVMTERDNREDVIDKLLDIVLGADRSEWSSEYGYGHAVIEVEERMHALASAPVADVPLTHRCANCGAVFQGAGCPSCRLAAPVASAPVAKEAVCKTCGGSRVDPGGLPICRDCGPVAGEAQPTWDDLKSLAVKHSVWVPGYGPFAAELLATYGLAPAEQPHWLAAWLNAMNHAAPQASECECSRKSKAVSDSEAQL